MTRFVVDWLEEALDDLAHLWLTAHDRAAVTDAEVQINRLLGSTLSTRVSMFPKAFTRLSCYPWQHGTRSIFLLATSRSMR